MRPAKAGSTHRRKQPRQRILNDAELARCGRRAKLSAIRSGRYISSCCSPEPARAKWRRRGGASSIWPKSLDGAAGAVQVECDASGPAI